ncbi:DUF642 domain-containing protein [Candidatus Parcubacteria bacterium]|nr:MAG: DUF642 domain-containing protein [Candidatus Parcubacteria bacterium]
MGFVKINFISLRRKFVKSIGTALLIMFFILSQVNLVDAFEAHTVSVQALVTQRTCNSNNYSVAGYVFKDSNQDKQKNHDENGLAGIIVKASKIYNSRHDYNNDNSNNEEDVLYLKKIAAGEEICPGGKICNFNSDTWIDSEDIAAFPLYPIDFGNQLTDMQGYFEFSYLDYGTFSFQSEPTDARIKIENSKPVTVNLNCGTNIINFAVDYENPDFCGDGIKEENEQCDDGNLENLDGCSGSCEIENICLPDKELIKNGSFELPKADEFFRWLIVPDNSKDFFWHVEWLSEIPDFFNLQKRPEKANLELHKKLNGWAADDGLQYAELDSDWDGPEGKISNEPASIKIYQDITTVPGNTYVVGFSFLPRPGTVTSTNALAFEVNGEAVRKILPSVADRSWQKYLSVFTATTTISRIQFVDEGRSDSFGTFLDDVTVKCLPQNDSCQDADNDKFFYGSGCHPSDCDDKNDRINPQAEEICGNFTDDDCDGNADCYDENCQESRFCVQPFCGNDIPDEGEDCDDGNILNGDFCSNKCKFEPKSVVINEIFHNVDSCHGSLKKFQWLELYNNSDYDVNLKNWHITLGQKTSILADEDKILKKHEFALVIADHDTKTFWNIPESTLYLTLLDGFNQELDVLSGKASLSDSDDRKIDSIGWEKDDGKELVLIQPGKSLSRFPAGNDTDSSDDFFVQNFPSPGRESYSFTDEGFPEGYLPISKEVNDCLTDKNGRLGNLADKIFDYFSADSENSDNLVQENEKVAAEFNLKNAEAEKSVAVQEKEITEGLSATTSEAIENIDNAEDRNNLRNKKVTAEPEDENNSREDESSRNLFKEKRNFKKEENDADLTVGNLSAPEDTDE